MTTETSNARGEWVLVPREVVDFLLGEGALHGAWFGGTPTGEQGPWFWRKHLRHAKYAAPPPAAARVDVRGLVALAEQWERDAGGCRRDGYMDAAVVKENCAFRLRQALGISAIAEALAAEGVQAGEVSAEDVAVLHRLKAALPDVGVNGWYEGVQALERVLARLSQQPEARGVVDEAMVERAWVAFCESAGSARQGIRAALTAALATQHQEPKP